ncbi:MAG TPA: hypothetical protein VGP16_18995, partial [Asanoa sp.]|nr:hypothetical protein [Asanoa sp.]
FWEPGGDVIHYTVSNLLADGWSRFVVAMFCPPGVEMITYVDDEELAAKHASRVSSADPSAPAGWPARPATPT